MYSSLSSSPRSNLTRFHNWRIRSAYVCPGSEKYQKRRSKKQKGHISSMFDSSSNIDHLYNHRHMLQFEFNERECVTEISSVLYSSPVILTVLCAFCSISFILKWILSVSTNLVSLLSTTSYILPEIKSITSLKCLECLMKVFLKSFGPLYVTSTASMKRMNQNKIYKERNKQKIKEQEKKYYEMNKEKIKGQMKKNYEMNKEKINDRMKKHYQINKQKIKDQYTEKKDKVRDLNSSYWRQNKSRIIEKRKCFIEEMCCGKRRYIESCSKSNEEQNNSGRFPFLSDSSNEEEMEKESSGYEKNIEKIMSNIDKRFCHATTVIDEKNGLPNSNMQRANVCVVCDRLIIGMEEVKNISKQHLTDNAERLSVSQYEEHFSISLKQDLVIQYQVEDYDLKDLLLSPRAQRSSDGNYYQCCSACYNSLTKGKKEEGRNPPKFSIANGFAIGHIPKILRFKSKSGEMKERRVSVENDFDDIISAAIAPTRPFGYVHAYSGGKQKCIRGHFSFFSVDQSHVGGVLNKYRNIKNAAKNIFVVLCGRMTPEQKKIVQRQVEFNTELFLDTLTWFATESGHYGYRDVVPPDECPDPVAFLQDEDTQNNTDEPDDPSVECRIGDKTYYFSNEAQFPNQRNSIFDNNEQFLNAMLDNTAPTLLMYGGSYIRGHEVNLEDAFPIQFPFGLGGPTHIGGKRRVAVSFEECLRHYMRLSMNQFMRPDFILVCYHMLCRNASYTSGIIKCKSNYKGKSLAERISQLSVHDIKEASLELKTKQQNNLPLNTTTTAGNFLKSISTSCKVLGHTTEAAKEARRKVYALTEFFGAHSIFFTVTPDDECTFIVRMYANSGEKIYVPGCDCNEEDCIADFKLRAKNRTKYPGACSLYYQSVIQGVYEMLGWDLNANCKKGVGIFGEPLAIMRADEEQNRHTLHGHFLIWIKNFAKVRNDLFHPDLEKREKARMKMCRYVEEIFCSDYGYDQSLPVVHENCGTCQPLSELFKECEDKQMIRDGRHKIGSSEVEGKILECSVCGENVSTGDVYNSVMMAYKKINANLNENQENETMEETDSEQQNSLPSSYRRDIMSYRLPIDSLSEEDDFYFNERVRFHTATYRMNEHDWKHRASCFKHGSECRFCFPQQSCEHPKFVEDEDDFKEMKWSYVDENKDSEIVYPYTIESKRPVGSEYLNTHCKHITRKFGCNSNVQIGSPRCVFYVLHYATKSTQKEDRGVDFDKIGYQVIRRIIKERTRMEMELEMKKAGFDINDDVEDNEDDNDEKNSNEKVDDENYCFREGLSRFLIGMSVHLNSDVVSATMAHLLISQKGSRFSFSHQFRDLLVTQMLNHLNGDEIADFVLRRRNRGEEKELVVWADYSINDYLHRPDCLEGISFYEFGMRYEKKPFTFEQMKHLDEEGLPYLREGEMHFKEDHPGRRYCYLRQSSGTFIPKLSMPKGMLCDIDVLELEDTDVGDQTKLLRTNYSKIALVLFYPFRGNEIFVTDNEEEDLWEKFLRLKMTPTEGGFWKNGLEILQNMQDIKQSAKCQVPADPLNSSTVERDHFDLNEREEKNRTYESDEDCDYNEAIGIGEYTIGEGYEYEEDLCQEYVRKRELDLLMHGQKLKKDQIINPRAFTDKTLFPSEMAENQIDEQHIRSPIIQRQPNDDCRKIGTLLGFISGSMVGKIKNLADDENSEDCSNLDESILKEESNAFLRNVDWGALGFDYNAHRDDIPTMAGIAKKAMLEGNISLDNIQYAAYQIICSSFLLEILTTEWKKQMVNLENDHEIDLNQLEQIKQNTIDNLKKLGAKDQLLMFISGPAGAGKSTSISVAEKYCFEFCKAVGVVWKDETFLFTAMTGVAAALFGGLTIHSVAHLTSDLDRISRESISLWENVKVLIIDEISMASVKTINKLNKCLNQFKREIATEYDDLPTNMIFGGYSIIFSGDFRQIPPVATSDDQFLYKNPGIWENAINVAIILENSHRFKDDPEYGEIMMRMWKGNCTEQDFLRINERVIGTNGVEFPSIHPHTDIAYACHKNKDRNAVHAASFKEHIMNFPPVENDDLPPEHTVIVEALIEDAPPYKPRKKKNKRSSEEEIPPIRVRIDPMMKSLIYSRLGDDDVRDDNKPVDPALKLYVGAHCMINENDNVKEGLANGTMCRVVSIKRKTNEQMEWRNYDGRKVFCLNASDIEYVEFEHYPPTAEQNKIRDELMELKTCGNDKQNIQNSNILEKKLEELSRKRRFKLKPKSFYPVFSFQSLSKNSFISKKHQTRIKAKMTQLPVILNDATTGFKLQGSSKNQIILRTIDYRNNGWIYTALSRVRKLEGLFLSCKIDFRKFSMRYEAIRSDLESFDRRMKEKIPYHLFS